MSAARHLLNRALAEVRREKCPTWQSRVRGDNLKLEGSNSLPDSDSASTRFPGQLGHFRASAALLKDGMCPHIPAKARRHAANVGRVVRCCACFLAAHPNWKPRGLVQPPAPRAVSGADPAPRPVSDASRNGGFP